MNYIRMSLLASIVAVSSGCYGGVSLGNSTSDAAVMTVAEAQQQMVSRWNQTVQDNPSDFYASTGFSFIWMSFDQFPHPTFKGGSSQAYREFARLMLAYTQAGDNFEFLTYNHLFEINLHDSTVAPAPGADFGTLRTLIDFLVSNEWVSAETVTGLKQVQAKIAALG